MDGDWDEVCEVFIEYTPLVFSPSTPDLRVLGGFLSRPYATRSPPDGRMIELYLRFNISLTSLGYRLRALRFLRRVVRLFLRRLRRWPSTPSRSCSGWGTIMYAIRPLLLRIEAYDLEFRAELHPFIVPNCSDILRSKRIHRAMDQCGNCSSTIRESLPLERRILAWRQGVGFQYGI
jgi:hypothetical protein